MLLLLSLQRSFETSCSWRDFSCHAFQSCATKTPARAAAAGITVASAPVIRTACVIKPTLAATGPYRYAAYWHAPEYAVTQATVKASEQGRRHRSALTRPVVGATPPWLNVTTGARQIAVFSPRALAARLPMWPPQPFHLQDLRVHQLVRCSRVPRTLRVLFRNLPQRVDVERVRCLGGVLIMRPRVVVVSPPAVSCRNPRSISYGGVERDVWRLGRMLERGV